MWGKVQAWLNSLGIYALERLIPAVVILAIGLVCIRVIVKIITGSLKRSKLEKTAHNLIRSVIKVVLSVVLFMVVASFVGVDVTGVVALASVLTLAISLALQDALTNLIGGITLLNTKPFVVGDYVEVAGQGGTVQEVGLAYTRLTTGDNKQISIPNSAVVAAEIVNYTATGSRRVDIAVSASYDSPVELVLEALKEAAEVPERLQEKDIFAAVANYGDSAIEYTLRLWVATPDYWAVKFAVNKRIKEVFDAKGIVMTYPHLNVHLDK